MRKLVVIIVLIAVFFVSVMPLCNYSNNRYDSCYANAKSGESTTEITPYEGKIYHVFFHSLIVYPKLAFGSPRAKGYDNWMVTKDEFKKVIERLYLNNFVIVDINYIRDVKLSGKPLMLPKNKKPLIMSVDDVNYYEYMKTDGFAEKLIVDNYGKTPTTIIDLTGNRIVDYEGDIVPIVDSFVEKHPDFSYNGAKGIVAVTGFEGVFGYRINNLQGDSKKEAIAKAKKVADTLKKNGWRIACHSYSHSNDFKDGSISLEKLVADTEKWNNIIAPITGRTNIYIPPFGVSLPYNDARFKFLLDKGYDIYCPVYKKMNVSLYGNCMISNRLNIDGFTLKQHPERISPELFSVDNLLDRHRPRIINN